MVMANPLDLGHDKKVLASVLLSASVERVGVSRMRDFLFIHFIGPISTIP